MILTRNLTPKVYTEMSRDFQYIGHLIDVVFNDVKTNSDLIYYLPIGDNADISLVTLLSMTLGFIPRHKYNSKQLYAICSVLRNIIRNKGSLNAVIIAVNALLNAEGITETFDYTYEDYLLTVFIPEQLSDLTLLKDILAYISPAGIGYSIVKELKETIKCTTEIAVDTDVAIVKEFEPTKLSQKAELDARALLFNGTNATIGASQHVTILSVDEIKALAVKGVDENGNWSNE